MRHRYWCGVPALLFLFALGCEQGPPLDAFELSGRITELRDDGVGGEDPIPNAAVRFASDTRIVAETTADGSGRYRMRVASDHPFGQVRAEAEGYSSSEETVYFDSPQRRVDIALRRE
jgi:hypothetical protein